MLITVGISLSPEGRFNRASYGRLNTSLRKNVRRKSYNCSIKARWVAKNFFLAGSPDWEMREEHFLIS